MSAFHELVLPGLAGQELPLAPLKSQVTLVVNVASECGLTPQYAGLQALHERYQDRGFGVLGIPCNQFAAQEPGGDADILKFCDENYGITFPISSKLECMLDVIQYFELGEWMS